METVLLSLIPHSSKNAVNEFSGNGLIAVNLAAVEVELKKWLSILGKL